MSTIIIKPYDPQWAAQFELLYNAIWPHISETAISLEHVGSTSVPGLAAKPIIDLTIVVSNKDKLSNVIEHLAAMGINHIGNLGIEGREAFTRLPGYPDHNLYACVAGSQPLRNHITIRNTLRERPDLAKAYSELKYQLAESCRNDIDAYVEGKSAFLLSLLKHSGFSEAEISAIEKVNRKPES